MKLHNFD